MLRRKANEQRNLITTIFFAKLKIVEVILRELNNSNRKVSHNLKFSENLFEFQKGNI